MNPVEQITPKTLYGSIMNNGSCQYCRNWNRLYYEGYQETKNALYCTIIYSSRKDIKVNKSIEGLLYTKSLKRIVSYYN